MQVARLLLVSLVLVALVATLVVVAGCPAKSGTNDEGTYGVGMNMKHMGHKAPATANAMAAPVANSMAPAAKEMAPPPPPPGKAPVAPAAPKAPPAPSNP